MEQAIQSPSSSLGRLSTLALACVVWLTFFIWYWAKIPGMQDFLQKHQAENLLFEFMASTYPWGGAAMIVAALLFVLTENVRRQTELYKTCVNVFWILTGIAAFFYIQMLLPRTLQGLT